jgi:ankyrin repeat protein
MAFPLHPIHRAIYEQELNFDHIKGLIASDPSSLAAVNTQNGYSLLHAAARRGNPALMRLLVQSGCYLDARTKKGISPFMVACQVCVQ